MGIHPRRFLAQWKRIPNAPRGAPLPLRCDNARRMRLRAGMTFGRGRRDLPPLPLRERVG